MNDLIFKSDGWMNYDLDTNVNAVDLGNSLWCELHIWFHVNRRSNESDE